MGRFGKGNGPEDEKISKMPAITWCVIDRDGRLNIYISLFIFLKIVTIFRVCIAARLEGCLRASPMKMLELLVA